MPYHENGPVLGRFDIGYLPMSFVVILFVSCCAAAQESRPAEPIRINVAEGIIEPFWDPEISTFDEWAVDDGQAHGLRVFQNWAAVDFTWADSPESGPALRMERSYPISCAGYDTLLVRLAAPKSTGVHSPRLPIVKSPWKPSRWQDKNPTIGSP